MKKHCFVFAALYFISSAALAQVSVKNLLCENRVNPIGLDNTKPAFSWQLSGNDRNLLQTAYEIRVGDDSSSVLKGKNLWWNPGKVSSDQSVHVIYDGKSLESGKKMFWQVRVWGNGKVSAWSRVNSWQVGLLQTSDWKAKWISIGFDEDSVLRPSPIFRKSFTTSKNVRSASIYITSHGLYEGMINGKRIGDSYLTPGWTSYNKRLQYQVYDVTNLIRSGKNAIGVSLGSGWYRGFLAFEGQKNTYGRELALLVQLELTYTDGTHETVISDESWKSTTGAIRSSEIYNGEIYDANAEKAGWAEASYDDKDWHGVTVKDLPKETLIATYNEPIRKHETFQPVKIFQTPKGEKVIDFGQNLVGWVQVKVKGNKGDSVRIYHAEVLDKDGNFYTDNLRAAKEQNVFVLKGNGEESFEPHFTFQGFRYIKVEGYPGDLKKDDFTAVAMYSDMTVTGNFTSSHPLLNQLQHNIQWGQRGNFLDVPTDCPQRDERLGWTGDAQVFSRTAAFNMHVANFFTKWLKDVAADQLPSGSVPFVIPNVLGSGAAGSTGWADAATIIPWNMYLAYGDKRVLEQQYPSMQAWIKYMVDNSKNDLWNKGFHFGDWLFYRPDDDNSGRAALTDKYLIAQCFFAHSTQLLINTAEVLGKEDDKQKYTDLLKRVKAAFLKEYVTANGRLVSSSQTAYVLALNFDMLPAEVRPQAAERLVQNIHDYGNHLTTGFLGTPYLCHVLTRFGYNDVAYTLLMQETYPSWLYPVKMGATTIWERWDGQKPDSTFQTPGMNSFNHYAYGAIGDWMYRVIAGIDNDTLTAGYKQIRIRPHLGGKLESAAASLDTYYGKVSSSWKVSGNALQFDVEIPANTKAVVYIPASDASAIKESGKALNAIPAIKVRGKEAEYVVVEVGSGTYHFSL